MTPSFSSLLAGASMNSNPFALHWSLYPKTYLAPRIPNGSFGTVDGDLSKSIWQKAPWSQDFDDIRGKDNAPPNNRPRTTCRTRMKMLWDDTNLYIGAVLHSDMTVDAHFTKRNSPIFQRDSDFEAFVDPTGTCHWYKEWEGNAINTVWNLMLNCPYSDGGEEHSGRVAKPGDTNYYDVKHQTTATRVIEGRVNNDEGKPTVWSVEIKMAHTDLLAHVANASLPTVGSRWRINFSRVEKQGAINWTWQPQIVWNAASHRFMGQVNMHLPDAWGYLVFGNDSNETTTTTSAVSDISPRDLSWPARLAAMNLYYAQQEYKERTGAFATNIKQLSSLVNQAIVSPFQVEIESLKHESDESNLFVLTVKGNPDGSVVTVTDKRLLQVHHSNHEGKGTDE